jgi:hypothetical protein
MSIINQSIHMNLNQQPIHFATMLYSAIYGHLSLIFSFKYNYLRGGGVASMKRV